MTSDQALTLDYVPGRVIVLGGGVIGVEFASVFRSFGSEVTIIEALPRLVANEDEALSKALERAFRRRRINYKTGVRFAGAQQSDAGVTVSLESGETIEADILLVAVGRGPNATGFGYEEVGVRMDRGFVLTDERLRTNVPNVYAVGDIVPGLQLAHRGFAQGIFVAEQIAGLEPAPIVESRHPARDLLRPRDRLGGGHRGAGAGAVRRRRRRDLRVQPRRERQEPDPRGTGFVKLVRQKDGPVVGVHMIGPRISEQVGEAQLIVNWEAFPEEVAQLVHAHPTQNEAMGEAHLALAGKPLHVH